MSRAAQVAHFVDIARLDYSGRAIEIWAAARDAAKLAEITIRVRDVWDHVRPAIEARGGTAEVARFDRLVVGLQAARSPDGYRQLVGPFSTAST